MNLKSIVAILVIAAVPVCAQAQKPAKVTKEDAQKVFDIVSGDKAKLQAYCDLGKLGDQMAEANEEKDSKKFEELSRKADELPKELGPEFTALMNGLPDIDPDSEDGQAINSTIVTLDKLCS